MGRPGLSSTWAQGELPGTGRGSSRAKPTSRASTAEPAALERLVPQKYACVLLYSGQCLLGKGGGTCVWTWLTSFILASRQGQRVYVTEAGILPKSSADSPNLACSFGGTQGAQVQQAA